MMICETACPKCHSFDTETLIVINNIENNECLACRHEWFCNHEKGERAYRSPEAKWSEFGEETW